MRPIEASFTTRTFVVYIASTLGDVARKIITGEEKNMGFKELDAELAFSPDRIGDFAMGRVIGLKPMDNKPNVKMVLLKTVRPVLDADGKAVIVDGKPKTEPVIVRIIDFKVVGAVETLIPDFKKYDPKSDSAKFMLVEVAGFDESPNKWPIYRMAEGTAADMKEEMEKRGGVALLLHPRVNKNASRNSDAGSTGSTGASTGSDDDIPF